MRKNRLVILLTCAAGAVLLGISLGLLLQNGNHANHEWAFRPPWEREASSRGLYVERTRILGVSDADLNIAIGLLKDKSSVVLNAEQAKMFRCRATEGRVMVLVRCLGTKNAPSYPSVYVVEDSVVLQLCFSDESVRLVKRPIILELANPPADVYMEFSYVCPR